MKVYRKRRQTFIVSRKIKHYFIYSIGEIVLIVIGILIAWKINSLNEVRKNKIVQIKIYVSLCEELNTNFTVLDSAIVRYNDNISALTSSLNYVGLLPENLTQEEKDRIVQIKFRNTNLRDEALSSVNATDKFQFLENHTVTELIAQYPNELKSFADQEMKLRTIVNNRVKPILEKHLSLIDLLPEDNDNYTQIKTFGQKSNYAALLNSKEYQNSAIDQLLQTQIQLGIAKGLQEKTKILAIKLMKELEG